MLKVKRKVSKFHQKAELVYQLGKKAIQEKVLFLSTEDESFNGRNITLNGKEYINYGSCSYLGLETSPILKEGAIKAIENYGTQFSSSRSFVSCGLYEELESLLSIIFNSKPVLLATSTSMAHITTLPVVVGPDDLVLCDQQAHFSMQYTFNHLAANGTDIFICKHNEIDQIEEQIVLNYDKYDKIWYLIDGVYSMYGDFAPYDKILKILNKYEKLHLYVDDAHGFSWTGKNGSGHCLSIMPQHERMILAVSINKSFASGGGCIVFPNQDMYERVKYYGGHLTFSGPLQPAIIGAGIASAKLHLSNEIYTYQSEFEEKRKYCNQIAQEYNIPIVSNQDGPIFYIGLGLQSVGFNMVNRVKDDGCYVNLGTYPAVPEMRTGIRFTITNHHSFDDIEKLVKSIATNLPKALQDEDRTMKDIERAFRRVPSFKMPSRGKIIKLRNSELTFKRYETICNLDKQEWDDHHFKNNGLSYNALELLEKSYEQNNRKEHNWDFFYYNIKDNNDELVLSACFCLCLVKDDMFLPDSVSSIIEQERDERNDPYYLTSEVLMLGTPLAERDHLYINKKNKLWTKAFSLMLDELWKEQDKRGINTIILKNFTQDVELNKKLYDHGFIKIEDNEYLDQEHKNDPSRYKELLKDKKQELDYKFGSNEDEIESFKELFEHDVVCNLESNRFSLPAKLFKNIHENSNWETLKLYKSNRLDAICFSVVEQNKFVPLIFGTSFEGKSKNIGVFEHAFENMVQKQNSNQRNSKLEMYPLEKIEKQPTGFIQQRDNYTQKMIENICLKWKKQG